jgi:hypothetical protein
MLHNYCQLLSTDLCILSFFSTSNDLAGGMMCFRAGISQAMSLDLAGVEDRPSEASRTVALSFRVVAVRVPGSGTPFV